jgi:hypothetical protein
LEEPGVDRRTALKWILIKLDVKMWDILMSIRIGTSGELL